jgi:hypothetical protein
VETEARAASSLDRLLAELHQSSTDSSDPDRGVARPGCDGTHLLAYADAFQTRMSSARRRRWPRSCGIPPELWPAQSSSMNPLERSTQDVPPSSNVAGQNGQDRPRETRA